MAIKIEELVRSIRPYVPDTVDSVIKEALLYSANRFCRESGVWRETLDVDKPRSGKSTVELGGTVKVGRPPLLPCRSVVVKITLTA